MPEEDQWNETVDQGTERVRLSQATPNDDRGDGDQSQEMEFVDWDGHQILNMSGPEWNFMVERHRAAVAREFARPSRPHLLRMKWKGRGDEITGYFVRGELGSIALGSGL